MVVKYKKPGKSKPFYKQFVRLRENIQNKIKVLRFKKKKWELLQHFGKKNFRRYKRFKVKDRRKYSVTRWANKGTSAKKKYRDTLQKSRMLRIFYGNLSEKSLKKSVSKIEKKHHGDPSVKFLGQLETRLDTVLYRAKFLTSVMESSQMILHGKIFVNNFPVTSKSHRIKTGDTISIAPEYMYLFKIRYVNPNLWPIPPKHLIVNYKTMQITILSLETTNFSYESYSRVNVIKTINNYLRYI